MTHPAIEAVARAMAKANLGFEANLPFYHEDAITAIRALLDVPVSDGMVEAWAKSTTIEVNGTDDDIDKACASRDWTAMLAQLVKEVEGGG